MGLQAEKLHSVSSDTIPFHSKRDDRKPLFPFFFVSFWAKPKCLISLCRVPTRHSWPTALDCATWYRRQTDSSIVSIPLQYLPFLSREGNPSRYEFNYTVFRVCEEIFCSPTREGQWRRWKRRNSIRAKVKLTFLLHLQLLPLPSRRRQQMTLNEEFVAVRNELMTCKG